MSTNSSRRGFLGSTLAMGGASLALGGSPLFAAKNTSRKSNKYFVRTSGDASVVFKEIQAHENDHVEFLVNALGSSARPKPTFQGLEQGSIEAFASLSLALENTGVGAYLGATPAIFNPAILAAAASIATVEARHAGYLNVALGDAIVPGGASFDAALSIEQVVAAASPFVADLNGGSALTFSATASEENDIAILNFALALEYLEAEFYNINVPKFF